MRFPKPTEFLIHIYDARVFLFLCWSCCFVGLKKWQTAREEWCQKGKRTHQDSATGAAVPIDVDGVIDVLFDPRWRGGVGSRAKASLVPPRFPTNVPLPQMIDVLTDLWEAEGLDV